MCMCKLHIVYIYVDIYPFLSFRKGFFVFSSRNVIFVSKEVEDMGLLKTPRSERLHIAIFGRRNIRKI